jgi:hypothetical protein
MFGRRFCYANDEECLQNNKFGFCERSRQVLHKTKPRSKNSKLCHKFSNHDDLHTTGKGCKNDKIVAGGDVKISIRLRGYAENSSKGSWDDLCFF